MTDYLNTTGGEVAQKHPRAHGVYSQLCQRETLARAFTELAQNLPAGLAQIDLESENSVLARLSADLRVRAYQPGGQGGDGPLRDLVVQRAVRIVLEPLFAATSVADSQTDKAVEWVGRNIERGLTRVHAARLELGTEVRHDQQRIVQAIEERVADAEFVRLLANVLACAPHGSWGTFLAPVLTSIGLEQVDTILQEAKTVGRRETILHVNCGRFGSEVIVLVDSDSRFDWVLPAVEARLRAACADLKLVIDETAAQTVDLGKGDKLTFLDVEFRFASDRAKGTRVRYSRVGKGEAPVEAMQSARRSWRECLGAPMRWLVSSFGMLPGACVRLIPKFLRQGPGRLKAFFVSDWRTMAGTLGNGLLSLPAWFRDHWKLSTAVVSAACVVLVLSQLFAELSWEKALNDDLPGFFSGAHYSDFGSTPYALYIPPGFSHEEEERPLIVFLDDHVDPTRTIQGGLALYMRERVKSGGEFNFAVFFPGHPREQWVNSQPGRAIMATLDHVVTRHRLDPNRVYLIGHSMGGWTVWRLATKFPDRWAAMVCVNPTWLPSSRLRVPSWVFECSAEKRPYPIDVRKLTDAFEATQTEFHYSAHAKCGGDYWKEVYNAKLFTWLAQKKR